ncbi:MAG: hypothetical protein K9W43_05490 [Candidatus Thorarchaeota archaeon]|nr:hypothetical protein [Candidatus Thorarchaeota archaeon]
MNPQAKRYKILFTLGKANHPLTFNELGDFVGIRHDTPGRRTSLYKILLDLQREGVIQVIREPDSTLYYTNDVYVRALISRLKANKLNELKLQKREQEARKRLLEELTQEDMQKTSAFFITRLLRQEQPPTSSFSRGGNQLIKLLHEKLVNRIRKGDIIRVSVRWGEKGFFKEDGVTMKMLKRLLVRGAFVKVLGPDKKLIDRASYEVTRRLYKLMKVTSDNVEIRLRSKTEKTYEAFLKNSDIGILVISYYPEPMVQYIPHEANPKLLEDMTTSFDSEFAEATPMI